MAGDNAHHLDPQWGDLVMRELPAMYQAGRVTMHEDMRFVYAATFFAVGEQLKKGVTSAAIRQQTSRVLRSVDKSARPAREKEHFAALFARAVADAIAGRPPCVLH